jgi:hypothetical protein
MLVKNDAFKAELFAIFHLIEVLLIIGSPDHWVKVTAGNRCAWSIGWHLRIGEKVEVINSHLCPFL